MFEFIAKRILLLFPVVGGVSVLVFLMLYLIPGDPVLTILRETNASPEQIARLRHELGFDQPLPVQYLRWVVQLAHGNLGESLVTTRPVASEIRSQAGSTLQLALATLFIAIGIGFVLGTLAAYNRNSWLDTAANMFVAGGVSMPHFWLGLLLIFLFSFRLHLLPAVGQGGLKSLVLPASTLGIGFSAIITRLTRSSLLDVLSQQYIQVARAKGLREKNVLIKHTFRNSLVPITTVVGTQLGGLIGGAVVVEVVFARQGIGQLLVQGILNKDIPLVQGIILLIAFGYVLINLLVDLSYVIIDPRIAWV